MSHLVALNERRAMVDRKSRQLRKDEAMVNTIAASLRDLGALVNKVMLGWC